MEISPSVFDYQLPGDFLHGRPDADTGETSFSSPCEGLGVQSGIFFRQARRQRIALIPVQSSGAV